MSVTFKEFLADIDVSLGGRAAEELSEPELLRPAFVRVLTGRNAVFGRENVTSGASSDLKHATAVATRMVKVRVFLPNNPTRLPRPVLLPPGFAAPHC